jgi:hypothetical protein
VFVLSLFFFWLLLLLPSVRADSVISLWLLNEAFKKYRLELLLLLLFGVRPSNKHCPSARCPYAANAVGKDLDIFAIGAFSLNHIYSY